MARLATSESVITYAYATDVGCVRTENQDACGKFPPDDWDLADGAGQLVVIADGMGGLNDGAEASHLAVKRVGQMLLECEDKIDADDMRSAFMKVNKEIYELHNSANGNVRMGTTCTALLLCNGSALVGHVGDSRLYRINGKGMMQLTHDHSNVAEMQRRGILTEDEAATHPDRSKLYRALGPNEDVEVDIINNLTLTSEEYFVLCTDGLHNKVSDDEIRDHVVNNPPDVACNGLVKIAKERGGEDNITLQVVHLKGPAGFIERVFKKPLR